MAKLLEPTLRGRNAFEALNRLFNAPWTSHGQGVLKIRLCRLVKLDWCAAPVFRFRHMTRVAARHTTDEPLAEHEGGQDGGEDQQNLSGWESDHLSCLRLELTGG